MFTNSPVSSNLVMPKFFADFGSLFKWYPITTHLSPCTCSSVPPATSLKVSLSSHNKPSGVGVFRTGGLTNNFLISLKAFSASSVHLNFWLSFANHKLVSITFED